ncbi:MAG: NAD(+) synthase [Bulleidia sp.]
MRNRMMKTAAAVPSLKVADVSYNTQEIIAVMKENTDCGLIVFPELCITGYTCADLFNQSLLLEKAENALGIIAKASNLNQTVVVGVPVRYGNSLYNCAAYISEGRIAGLVPKINIPTYSEFYEGRWFTSGRGVSGKTIEICGQQVPFGTDLLFDNGSDVVIGTDICEDLWVMDKPSTHACMAGANVIVNLSASDEVIGKYEYRRNLVSAHSGDCYCAYIYASAGNDESSTDLVFSGHCMIAESGKILSECIYPHRSHVETALIDIDRLIHDRIHQNTCVQSDENYRHIHVEAGFAKGNEITALQLKELLKQENRVPSRMPFVPQDDRELAQRCQNILRIQAQGLATRVRSTGIHTLVIGISGGLDSTLALLVCNEARKIVPEIHIIAITMPNKGNTTSQTYNNAMSLMKLLDTEIREVEIGAGVNSHLNDIGHPLTYQGDGDTAYENAQARMRTYILMDTANMENGLVVGTGDLSELALGWCTYNGDHMSMYGVNASVPKTLVQYICRAYALTCGNEALKKTLLAIVDTPISPELTPSDHGVIAQKTEDKIGKYDLNDFFLYWVMRYGMEPQKILGMAMAAYDELDEKTVRDAMIRFYNRFFHQQFKRSCLPDGPKVGSVTLSPRGDWRMPSDAAVAMWLKELNS